MRREFSFGLAFVRSIAILIVFIYHFSSNILPNGYIGVDLFFVLSGYLIYKSSFSNVFITMSSLQEFLRKTFLTNLSTSNFSGSFISLISIFVSTNFRTFKTHFNYFW